MRTAFVDFQRGNRGAGRVARTNFDEKKERAVGPQCAIQISGRLLSLHTDQLDQWPVS